MEGDKVIPRKELRPSPPPILERFRSKLKEVGPMTTGDIVGFYEELLVELTSNSKPIITELSIIAGEQKEHREEIASAICERILKVPMEHKLPSLYLLDSIVKNIGREYERYFAGRLHEVFCETYKKVNSSLRSAMRHLFKTWPPFFPSSVLCKIEDELQFSPQENQKPAGSADVRHSESQSPRPSHVIHVNPKYLEACHHSEHSAVIHESDTRNNAQMADFGGERMEKNASESPKGWSRASSKYHDAQHARVPSSLQSYGKKSSFQFGEYDFDHPELLPARPGFERVGTAAVGGVEGPLTHSRPSSPPRIGLRRSISPPGDGFQIDTFPERVLNRASLSHSGLGFGSGRASDRNGRLARSWPSGDSAQNPEASSAYNLNNGCDKLRARLLIDAYGGKDISHEKLPKVQRLDVNGVRSDTATRNLQSAEEEEYIWENMSPTLANQSRGYNRTPFGFDTGLSRPNAILLGNEFRRGDWPSQAPMPRADDPANVIDDVIPVLGSGHRSLNNKHRDDIGSRKESWLQYQNSHHAQQPFKFPNIFPQSLQQNLSPKSHGRVLQMPFSASGTAPTMGQKMPSPFDNARQAEVPFQRQRLSSNHPDSLIVEASAVEKNLAHRPHSPHAASVIWPPLHKSQPLPLLSIPPHKQQFRNPLDLEPNKPIVNPGPNPSSFLPWQQFDNSDIKPLNSLPYQQSGFYLNQQSLKQTTNLRIQSHEAHGSFVPPVPAQLPSHLVPETLNHVQPQGTVMVPVLPNLLSGIPPPLPPRPHPPPPPATQNISSTSMLTPAGPLPPLPPGPPPASSQIRPPSQNTASAYSGLISSLMAQGLISLTPPIPSQDAEGVEFNVERLKVRHESSVNALYGELSRQCTTCGLRFRSQEEHSSHMDWHVTKNRIAKNQKQKPSRNWFVNAKEWLSGAETLRTDVVPGFFPSEAVAERKEDREVAVPADENQNICALCGEPFEDFYSDKTEEWMYKGAVYLNSPNGSIEVFERSQLGPIVHAKCRPESTDGSGKT